MNTSTDGVERREQMFPTLSPAQLRRFEHLGQVLAVEAGTTLFAQGDDDVAVFLVLEGQLSIFPHVGGREAEVPIVVHGPGEFSGEFSSISGRRALVSGRMTTAGRVRRLARAELLQVVQTDSELSELFLRAFILRRTQLIRRGEGDVVLVGSTHSADTLRLQEFLARNGHPYTSVDVDRDEHVQDMLDAFQVRVDEVPVVICRNTLVLKRPTNAQLADCLGLNPHSDASVVWDVVVVGAGPAGLAAAVYAASEGLRTVVLESHAPGGQAGSSSKIENYLGFPTGISGQALAARAFTQAEKFGAEVRIARVATRLRCERKPFTVELDAGEPLLTRSIVIATGVQYHRPALPDLARFEGLGVYYGATYVESQHCGADEVAIVGGGNSAGQAAVFLARTAKHVHMLVRGPGLAESMSRYLIRRIEETPSITLHTGSQVVKLEGTEHLEAMHVQGPSGAVTSWPVRHLFLMTGASPNTRWLDGCLALDEKGFVLTDRGLEPEPLKRAGGNKASVAENGWSKDRAPFLYETSLPGVFAVGDVRAGSTKRVASAVGEGSVCISFVHKVLTE